MADLQPGDRAMLVCGCCAQVRSFIVRIVVVGGPIDPDGSVRCRTCETRTKGPNVPIEDGHIPLSWLRKQPPPEDVALDNVLELIELSRKSK